MDDAASEATQPATQLVMDPRRMGENSSEYSDEDIGDIVLILHPASASACIVASNIGEIAPEHTVSRTSVPMKIKGASGEKLVTPGTMELAAQGLKSCDIALRLSANLKDPLAGFTFGRNRDRADFVISHPSAAGMKRISNVHFRIWLQKSGVIMLEDSSTNGTYVENKLLRALNKENNGAYRHTLTTGSMIKLSMAPDVEDDIQFVVRLPNREDSVYDDIFHSNLTDYFARLEKLKDEKAKAGAEANEETLQRQAPDIFGAQSNAPRPNSEIRRNRNWNGGRKYEKGPVIGRGAFAVVYMLIHRATGIQYAGKEIEKRKFMKHGILDQKVEYEMKIMSKIKHDHVVQFIEHIDWVDHIYIVMEYVPGGTLSGHIEECGTFSENDTRILTVQMLDALKYLGTLGITHRDIKPDNVLVQSGPPHLHVKLTDFGLSKLIVNDDTNLRTFCGTLLYCAPEVYPEYKDYFDVNDKPFDKKAKRYDSSVDLWSLAGVLFYVLTRDGPYKGSSKITIPEMLRSIMLEPLDVRPLQAVGLSEDGIHFIKSMLHVQPEYRATIEQLEASAWLNPRRGSDGSDMTARPSYGYQGTDTLMSNHDGSDLAESLLEESTSQLSIYDGHEGDSQESGVDLDALNNAKTVFKTQTREIPSSFTSNSFDDSSQDITPRIVQQPRLFGEVNFAGDQNGRSSILPHNGSALPAFGDDDPTGLTSSNVGIFRGRNGTAINTSNYDTAHSAGYDMTSNDSYRMPGDSLSLPAAMQSFNTLGAARNPSLTGAESMVGDMNIASPSPGGSNLAASHQTATKSMRRPRESNSQSDEERPIAKRNKSMAGDSLMPVSVFWDMDDPSTHHTNYPALTLAEYHDLVDTAAAQGEKFERGSRLWDTVVGIHSRASSPDAQIRARSEPVVAGRRPPALARDDRTVGETASAPSSDRGVALSSAESSTSKDAFQQPRRVLAKFTSTSDSCLQDLTLNITEVLTTWGRHRENTIVYPSGAEVRVPRVAFKLIFWRNGVLSPAEVPTDEDNEYMFFITTKCRFNIEVNGVKLEANDPEELWKGKKGMAKNWGRLQTGDVVTAWKDKKTGEAVRFRFDCFWGNSKFPRESYDPFHIINDPENSHLLGNFCQWEEDRHYKRLYDRKMAEKGSAENSEGEGSENVEGVGTGKGGNSTLAPTMGGSVTSRSGPGSA